MVGAGAGQPSRKKKPTAKSPGGVTWKKEKTAKERALQGGERRIGNTKEGHMGRSQIANRGGGGFG